MKVLAVFLTQLAIALCFENRTLFQYLDAQREFSTFVGLIKHANLSDLLKAPGTLTLFVSIQQWIFFNFRDVILPLFIARPVTIGWVRGAN